MGQVDIVEFTEEVQEMQFLVEEQLSALQRFKQEPDKLVVVTETIAEAVLARLGGVIFRLNGAENDPKIS